MAKPIIGISGSILRDNGGWTVDLLHAYVNQDYTRSVEEAGGIPLIIPFTENHEVVQATVDHIDALLISGGHDLDPANYGQEPLQKIGTIWPERDQFDFALLKAAMDKGIPIFAICRGHQVVNVFHGGSLYQDLSYDPKCTIKHWQEQTPSLATHSIAIEKDSKLYKILGQDQWRVNSHHHQTVHEIGEGLKVTALAPDGTIEALESITYPWLVTCQFHPEMMTINSPEAKKIFEAFVQEASK